MFSNHVLPFHSQIAESLCLLSQCLNHLSTIVNESFSHFWHSVTDHLYSSIPTLSNLIHSHTTYPLNATQAHTFNHYFAFNAKYEVSKLFCFVVPSWGWWRQVMIIPMANTIKKMAVLLYHNTAGLRGCCREMEILMMIGRGTPTQELLKNVKYPKEHKNCSVVTKSPQLLVKDLKNIRCFEI